MAKKIEIEFDDQSLKILKNVPEIHRVSLINIGLSLASKTNYYKTLTGEASEVLNNVASLDNIENLGVKETETVQAQEAPKKSTSWDEF